MAEFQLESCPEATVSAPAFRRNAGHCRSRSEPAYEPSYARHFLQSKLVDCTQDKTRRWSCMLQGVDVDIEHRRKRRVILEQDVRELEMRLQNEKAVRKTLEKALKSSLEPLPGISRISPETKQLIKEIASLEVEVVCLEQHVLSLYRKLFETKLCQGQASASQDSKQRRQKKINPFQHRRHVSVACDSPQDSQGNNQSKTRHASLLGGNFECRSSDAENSARPSRVWPDSSKHAEGTPDRLNESNSPALPKGLSYRTPNLLSEEMVRCMASIFCNLADPPLQRFTATTPSPPFSTPTSSTSTSQEASSDGWSPGWQKESLTDGNPTVEVPWIRVNKERLSYAARALRNFRSMVEQLSTVQPNDMKNDEKVAFWINIYNALVMHAYLAYGIPRSHLKRVVLLQKAAYKVGALSINAYTIEHSILGCRPQRPAQWLQALFSPLTKFKAEERRAYSLNTPEPLVCFAICSGGRSDPPVRLYTPNNVKSELERAKREFLHANVCVKDKKIMVPKVVESYARDAGIAPAKLVEWIVDNASEKQQELLRTALRPSSSSSSSSSSSLSTRLQLEWLPYNSSFRYSFSRDLARTQSNRKHSLREKCMYT